MSRRIYSREALGPFESTKSAGMGIGVFKQGVCIRAGRQAGGYQQPPEPWNFRVALPLYAGAACRKSSAYEMKRCIGGVTIHKLYK